MTQQSLITRLKAVEEALAVSLRRMKVYDAGTLIPQVDEALSDLRELIKEAEGQKAISVRIVGGPDNSKYVPHYTALGEKP